MIKIFLLLFFSVSLYGVSIDLDKLHQDLKCDRVFDVRIYNSCYSYKYRAPLEVDYTINKNVNKNNYHIDKYWYSYRSIPKRYRQYNSDYYHGHYHKGHLAPKADFDYSRRIVKKTYYLGVNSVPQVPSANKYSWYRVEKRERKLAKYSDEIHVINIVKYPKNPKWLNNRIAIPEGFYKIIYNDDDLLECYYVKNEYIDHKRIRLNDFRIKCEDIPYLKITK